MNHHGIDSCQIYFLILKDGIFKMSMKSESKNSKTERNNDRDPQRMKKTKIDAQTQGFTTQLFYYTIKVLVVFILTQYKNILWGNNFLIGLFIVLLIINTYMMSTTGRYPGYIEQSTINQNNDEVQRLTDNENIQPQCSVSGQTPNHNDGNDQKISKQNHEENQQRIEYCDICNVNKGARVKHCFKCGKCVRKYDHHCPWIGACVGEGNHCKFLVLTFFHTFQACLAFWIFFYSMSFYEYKSKTHKREQSIADKNGQQFELNDVYSSQFGIFGLFSFFMFLYIVFAGILLFFHLFLIITNQTTNQLTARYKLKYLKGIKGNPFNKGLIKNLQMAILTKKDGYDWDIYLQEAARGTFEKRQRTFLEKMWSNQYYDCC